MASYEFVLGLEPDDARVLAIDVVEALGFESTWRGEWDALVQRGSRVRSVLLGAFSPHVRVGLAIRSLVDEGADDRGASNGEAPPEGVDADDTGAGPVGSASSSEEWTVLRLDNRSAGMLGGVMGAQKSRSGWIELRTALAERFADAGVLIEERDPGPSRIV